MQAIITGLKWLGLEWDDEIVMQSTRTKRHAEVVEQLLDTSHAYRCYLTNDEIQKMRAKNPHIKIESPWRDQSNQPVKGVSPTIRLKINKEGSTTINDKIRGTVTVSHAELDDMILLRSDGTPTYMFAVVVDDYDMKVTHIIRGDDHFTNSFRQNQIIQALSWPLPQYAHIPLIHGQDGTKLSKRHGALGVEHYKKLGYLPEAICNYLLRLGWSHGDSEILTKEEATKLFTLEKINNSPARFNWEKLNFLNSHYINSISNNQLIDYLTFANETVRQRVTAAMPELKNRANTLVTLQELADLYETKHNPPDARSKSILNEVDKELIAKIIDALETINQWQSSEIKNIMVDLAKSCGIHKSQMMQIMRALVLGSFSAPGVYDTMDILGKDETIRRLTL